MAFLPNPPLTPRSSEADAARHASALMRSATCGTASGPYPSGIGCFATAAVLCSPIRSSLPGRSTRAKSTAARRTVSTSSFRRALTRRPLRLRALRCCVAKTAQAQSRKSVPAGTPPDFVAPPSSSARTRVGGQSRESTNSVAGRSPRSRAGSTMSRAFKESQHRTEVSRCGAFSSPAKSPPPSGAQERPRAGEIRHRHRSKARARNRPGVRQSQGRAGRNAPGGRRSDDAAVMRRHIRKERHAGRPP